MNHGQAEAGAFPNSLRAEEWLHRALERRFVHAGSGVSHRDAEIVSWRKARGVTPANPLATRSNRDRTTLRHCIARIHREVQQGHFQLVGVSKGGRQLLRYVHDQADLRASGAVDQIGHAADELTDINRCRLQRLPAGKGKQALDKRFGPFSGSERAPMVRCARSSPTAAPLQQVQSADDRRQKVIEVMRNAAGELAHRFHLLALTESFLRSVKLRSGLAFGSHIAADRVEDIAFRNQRPGYRAP